MNGWIDKLRDNQMNVYFSVLDIYKLFCQVGSWRKPEDIFSFWSVNYPPNSMNHRWISIFQKEREGGAN